MLPAEAASAGQYKVLHAFAGRDGDNPHAGLIFDVTGSLYGTTTGGGAYGCGTVFKLTPDRDGSWTESVLHSFCSLNNCVDGTGPQARLIFDAEGNLYGTADGGVTSSCLFPTSE
jgi:uncharacterized repeat protein (TIGR03803 family)